MHLHASFGHIRKQETQHDNVIKSFIDKGFGPPWGQSPVLPYV